MVLHGHGEGIRSGKLEIPVGKAWYRIGGRCQGERRMGIGREAACVIVIVAMSAGCRGPAATKPDAGAVAVQADAASPDALPAAMLGMWYQDNAEGRASCAAYRALPSDLKLKPGEDPVEAWYTMLGAMVVTPRLLHDYAEYGEGNFYNLVEASPTGNNAWTLQVRVGIDGPAEEEQPSETVRVRLEGSRMHLTWPDGPRKHSETSFRCGDVRSDLYGAAEP